MAMPDENRVKPAVARLNGTGGFVAYFDVNLESPNRWWC